MGANDCASVAAHAGRVPSPAVLLPGAARVMASDGWRRVISAPWYDTSEHINVLECRAVLSAVRWSLRIPRAARSRFLVFSDSAVVTCALTKGRSSSPWLLRRVRSVAALLLGTGTQLHVHWIPSESNVSDSLSRLQTWVPRP